MTSACLGLAIIGVSAVGAADPVLQRFSTQMLGRVGGWQLQVLGKAPAPIFTIINEGGAQVVQAHANAGAAGTLLQKLGSVSPAQALSWRWKVAHTNLKADTSTREGDDYAARVYVSFDVPLSSLTFADRTRLRIARSLYGAEVPSAAICYVWDNARPVGTRAVSPYTSRVHVIVLQSGGEFAGQWKVESRDLAADFKAAFGHDAPAVTGVAFGLDMDQTGDTNTAWFGDFVLKAKP